MPRSFILRAISRAVVIAISWASHAAIGTSEIPGSGGQLSLAAAAKIAPHAGGIRSSIPLVADGADWPSFRGPQRDGAVHGVTIDVNWNDAPPKQVWKRHIGLGWSSIVVIGDRLFTQEQREDQEAVVCYDTETGDEIWVHLDDARFEEAMGGVGPRATPTFAEGRLFSLGATGILNCLDATTGDLKWSRDVKLDGQNTTPTWGFCSSPLVVNGKVIIFSGGGGSDERAGKNQKREEASTPDEGSAASEATAEPDAPRNPNTLLAYNVDSGDLSWRAPAGNHSYSSPQLAEFDGVPQVLFLDEAALGSIEISTGKRLWSLPTNARREGAPSIQPHIINGTEFFASFTSDAGLVRGKVTHDGDDWQVAIVWSSRDLKPLFSDFVRVGDALYGFDGSVFCSVDANTGKRNWKKGRYGSGQVLLVADQPVLVLISESGEAVLLAANPEKNEELGRFQALEGKTWNHPTIARGRLYVRNAEEMACYEL
jgi:outer membrane protein assembly factor BamB